MKESAQLLDLLSAAGSDDIEPTKAAAGRQALYPDVRRHAAFFSFFLLMLPLSSTSLHRP